MNSIDEKEKKLMCNFLKVKLPRYILTFMVDSLGTETSFYILNNMIINNNFEEVEKSILLSCKHLL